MSPTCCQHVADMQHVGNILERHADVGDMNVCDVGAKIGGLRGYYQLSRAYKVNIEIITGHVGDMS